jgi:hypothetical protein
MIPVSRLDRWIAYATDWSSGGVQRTIDMGDTWLDVRGTFSEWGADIAKDDPNVCVTSTYSGNTAYATLDRGDTWLVGPITGSNYGLLAYDRSTWIAHQSNGVHKATVVQADMPVSNEELVTLQVPNGGEEWGYAEHRPIRWSSQNFPRIRIDLQTDPLAPWQPLALEAAASPGLWEWTIPPLEAEDARIRVSDALDGIPSDESDLPFRLVLPALTASPAELDFVQVPIGYRGTATIHIVNSGSGTLVVSSVTVEDGGPFTPDRTSFSIPPGASDTLAVLFEPIAPVAYVDTLVVVTNTPGGPTRFSLIGKGTEPLGVGDRDRRPPERFALQAAAPNPFGRGGTVIAYDLPREADVRLEVYNVLGQSVATLIRDRQPAGTYAVRFPGAARVARGAASVLPSGVYFCRLEAGTEAATRRMVLVR